MTYLKCAAPRCARDNDLAQCARCGALACPLHGAHLADEFLCVGCSPATPAPRKPAGQMELFA